MFGYEPETALGIARAMMGNPDYPEFDDLCRSALSELANIVGGNAATGLAEMGLTCDLAPPSVITGDHMTIQTSASPMLFVPVNSSCGDFKLFIALKQSGK
jgi:chemotaxis protein CheX